MSWRACAPNPSEHGELIRAGACAQVHADVLALHGIASEMRARRFRGGALRLDNVKLDFRLDADGNPCEATPHGARIVTLATPYQVSKALEAAVLVSLQCVNTDVPWLLPSSRFQSCPLQGKCGTCQLLIPFAT